jgi:long-chain acyl-CoA synthetase
MALQRGARDGEGVLPGALLPRAFYAKEWFTNSLNYYLSCQFFNAFPLPQREAGTRRTMRYMGEILADGYSILIFPEGKRHQDEIAPFRPGIGMMGARLGVPVVPVRIEGVDKVLHPKWKWPAKGPVKVTFGRRSRCRVMTTRRWPRAWRMR